LQNIWNIQGLQKTCKLHFGKKKPQFPLVYYYFFIATHKMLSKNDKLRFIYTSDKKRNLKFILNGRVTKLCFDFKAIYAANLNQHVANFA